MAALLDVVISRLLANVPGVELPFTYTVRAFRSAICGGQDITGCLAYLAIWFVVATLLTLVLFQVRTRRIRAKQPTLMVWLEEHSLA